MTTNMTTISFSSVLKRAGKSAETILSAVDIIDDGIGIATNYMSRIKEEQLKEAEQKAVEFDNQLALRKGSAMNEFIASSYQIGAKSRQIQSLPEYQENMEAFNNLIK